jgi:hypothetical protein
MKMQPKLIVSAITAALLAGAVYAAENTGGGQPTSTPTHTVPVKPTLKGETEDETTGAVPGRPTDRLTIKTKSSPPFAPPIEDKKVAPTMGSNANAGESAIKPTGVINNGGKPGNPWGPVGQCYVGKPPANYRCPPGQKIVDLDPSPKVCWRCEFPKD